MKRLPRLPIALLLTALAGVCAGAPVPPSPTYRIIGPDGKVTFSDRKPTDPQLKARELGQIVIAPLLAPATQPFDLRPATSFPPSTRPPGGEALAPQLDASGRPFAPGLPEAVLDVLVHQFFVQTLVETCGRQRPAFLERYQIGVRNWRDRNAEVLDKSNRITFTRFTAEQRDTLRSTGRARLAQLMPPRDAPDADRTAWCDGMSTDLSRRQFELVGDLRVAPILYFQPPQ
jgi:hypothetical protein